MGAKIRGAGTDTITIEGVEHLKGCTHEIIPDRIEAGTFLIMAAAAGERVIIQNIIPQHLESLISKLKEMGVKMENVGDSIIVYGDNKNFNAVDVRTQVYPGFADRSTTAINSTAYTSKRTITSNRNNLSREI